MMKRMTECWKDRTRFVCVHRGWSGEEKGIIHVTRSNNCQRDVLGRDNNRTLENA